MTGRSESRFRMILLIDNYDSFVHNLARYFERLGVPTHVVRNDRITPRDVANLKPDAIVLSPGPCTPDEAGCSLEIVRQFYPTLPMLGVCLGHQTIAQALSASVVRGQRPWHGRASQLVHNSTGLFSGLPTPLQVGRYHSLVVDPGSLPAALEANAWTDDCETIMAIAHCEYPVFGVQFHPESILTEQGYAMLANFLRLANVQFDVDPAVLGKSEQSEPQAVRPMPVGPVTF